MNALALRTVGLSKLYRIGSARARNATLRDAIASAAKRPLERIRHPGATTHSSEDLWALRDIDLEVGQGEVLGVIGRNGAGKTTLLKVLSHITEPTEGRVEIYGRVASLLEVGTGFHPELSGRENIFLNGAILGMRRREIQARFDEIVAFADVERFLDTPVKRYSTGMYMRLAFAVAAHLETDILVIDEVLAVGDAAFQAKSLGKMGEVARTGRTVLFVSHNMAAVAQLCTRVVLLDGGRIQAHGLPSEMIARYLGSGNQEGRADFTTRNGPTGSGGAVFEWAEVRTGEGVVCQTFSIGDTVTVAFGVRRASSMPRTRILVSIRSVDGTPIALISTDDSSFALDDTAALQSITVTFRDIRLYPNAYYVTLWATDSSDTEEYDRADNCLAFRIIDGGMLTTRWLPRHAGLIFLTPDWLNGTDL